MSCIQGHQKENSNEHMGGISLLNTESSSPSEVSLQSLSFSPHEFPRVVDSHVVEVGEILQGDIDSGYGVPGWCTPLLKLRSTFVTNAGKGFLQKKQAQQPLHYD